MCACVKFVLRRSSQCYNTQRAWQPSWWGRNVWCLTVVGAVRRANWKLRNSCAHADYMELVLGGICTKSCAIPPPGGGGTEVYWCTHAWTSILKTHPKQDVLCDQNHPLNKFLVHFLKKKQTNKQTKTNKQNPHTQNSFSRTMTPKQIYTNRRLDYIEGHNGLQHVWNTQRMKYNVWFKFTNNIC